MEPHNLAQRIASTATDHKALAVKVIDVRGLCSYADFLVLASGTSDRHVQAVAHNVEQNLKQEHQVRSLSREGLREGQWALVDFGSVVLHVFHEFTRSLYDLDALWQHAPQQQLVSAPPATAPSLAYYPPPTHAPPPAY